MPRTCSMNSAIPWDEPLIDQGPIAGEKSHELLGRRSGVQLHLKTLGMRRKGSIRPTQDGHGRRRMRGCSGRECRCRLDGSEADSSPLTGPMRQMRRPPGQRSCAFHPRLGVQLARSCVIQRGYGAAVPIGLGTAYYLAREGGDLSHAEDQEADEVRCRIAFGPFEVDVRATVSAVPHSQQ
jgi:hypothetical protein